jgi:hypothetical protein
VRRAEAAAASSGLRPPARAGAGRGRRRLSRVVGALAVLATALAGVTVATQAPAAAVTSSTQVPNVRNASAAVVPATNTSPAVKGHVGVDVLLTGAPESYNPCKSPSETYVNACSTGLGSYYQVHHFNGGNINFPFGIVVNNADKGLTHNWARKARDTHIEYYPYGPGGSYDPWTQDYGGVAFWSGDFDSGGSAAPVGTVPLPQKGQGNAGRLGGRILSTTPVTTGRVHSDIFQVEGWSATSSGGRPVGGFATLDNKGGDWTTGWVFNGGYLAVITDNATGTTIFARFGVFWERTVDLDLDAPCFGFEVCTYQSGAPPQVTGSFHDLVPARILDTRYAVGHDNSKVTAGDGRNTDPNPDKRLASRLNHEVQVTGVGGVPASGVGAVLLNVTVDGPTADSHLTVFPKPPGTGDIFNDQSSFGPVPTASNVNFRAGQTVANLVLAKVGAGGKIRIFNNAGATHVIFDVVGWYDDGHDPGTRFTGITPVRRLDTREGTGGPQSPFAQQTTRQVTVTGGDVPADAAAVVVNLTTVGGSTTSHLSAWPAGQTRPTVSNVNFGAGQVVPNLAVVKVGAGGQISLYNNSGTVQVVADVVGYFKAGTNPGRLTPPTPTRILDTRSNWGLNGAFGAGGTREVSVAGVLGVPPGATGVVLNVTVVGPSAGSHLTVWPAGEGPPLASNLNYVPGQTVPNLVMVKLGAGGRVAMRNESGNVHVVADVVGWYS